MTDFQQHLIKRNTTIREALVKLNQLSQDAIAFVVDEKNRLLGSLTDGDVRRGLLRGVNINENVLTIAQKEPKYIQKGTTDIREIIALRENNYRIIPILGEEGQIIKIINFRKLKSYLPVDSLIMAGGRGNRLKPLTDTIPKPLLKIGNKPIVEHNIDRLISFGVDDFWISIRYLGSQIEDYFRDGSSKNAHIEYVWEDEKLGTIGAISKVDNFRHNHILVSNSDLLTTLDYEFFFLEHLKNNADISVLTIPYSITIPYAVIETKGNVICGFEEKPTYTYYSSGGIYLIKRSVLAHVPKNTFFDATDLIEKVIKNGGKVCSFPFEGYWLDIGRKSDYEKAKADIETIDL